MKNIGVKNLDLFHLTKGTDLKKDLLYFDKILVDQDNFKFFTMFLNSMKKFEGKDDRNFRINEIEYLEKIGLLEITDLNEYYRNLGGKEKLDFFNTEIDLNELKQDFLKYDSEKRIQTVFDVLTIYEEEANLNSRIFCSKLNEIGNLDIKPIIEIREENKNRLTDLTQTKISNYQRKINVVNLVLKRFPVPDNSVSWEEIIAYKNNSDLKVYRLGILNWITEIGNSNLTIYEIEQKLEYLIIQYEERLKLEKLKYSIGNTELIITSTLDVFENLVKLKWSNAAKGIFNLKRRKADLMLGETLAPGREVAYISKIKTKFN